MTGSEIAAVIGTLGAGSLSACLAALRDSAVAIETIVVDQGPEPAATRAVVESLGARHLRSAERGLSRARNLGIAATRAPWICFPDDDCLPHRDFAERLLAFVRGRPEARFVCGRVVVDDRGRPLAPDMGEVPVEIRTMREVLRTLVSTGLAVHREVFEAVGGFDERLGVGATWPSGEESDLVLRARRAGFRGWYVPDAIVAHPEPFAIRGGADQARRAREYGRGYGALFAKHGLAPPDPAVMSLFAGYLARAVGGWLWAGVRGRRDLGARYAASLAGRWSGFHDYRAQTRTADSPPRGAR